jgi:hypothetical protein
MENAMDNPASFGRAFTESSEKNESTSSGVSWAAVIAGAFVTASLSLILMVLGAGMGLSAVSPWPDAGSSATRIAPAAIVWITFVELVSCAIGGYLAGRLRTKWVALHSHEVYFRDTAHGFLVWAVGLVIWVVLLSSVAAAVTRTSNTAHEGPGNYYVDSLFRTDHPASERNDALFREEAKEIVTHALIHPETETQDKGYLSEMVVARTGLNESQAEARVNDALTADRQTIEAGKKAVAHSLYWLFVALLIGAFCGSYAATIGGRQRDNVPVV